MIFTPGKERKITHCLLMQSALGVIQNPRAAVVIHNTRSCSKIVWDAFLTLGEKYEKVTRKRKKDGYIFSTGLTNQDAVFGANEKLRHCLEDIIHEMKPEAITVACGCVPGVIGDDTASICSDIERETNIPILLLPGHGFMVPGHIDTVTSLARMLFEKWTVPCISKEKKSNRCVIIGLSPAYSSQEEYQEIMEVLHRMGFTEVLCPPVGTDKKSYEEMGKASLVISFVKGSFLEKASEELGQYIAQSLQVPLVNWNHIYTPENSKEVFMHLAALCGKEEATLAYCKEKEKALAEELHKGKSGLSGKSCAIRLGISRQMKQVIPTTQLLRKMGVHSIRVVLSDMITEEEAKQIRADLAMQDSTMRWEEKQQKEDILLSTLPFDLRKSEELLLPSCLGYDGWIHFICRLRTAYGETDE